ncbi:hypothetical protein GH5_00117 [Leishmania sp. Ghana 2012 LV757]|uniref:hypothetical protein n=1 Tax=Leishmania sp. Ghana 2012 LV757 TaxID=2803181 RepID=UPI001B6716DC|nr:hypothetical protein GH5_00117 [Leishmania sp. Ghana 2012 LV757]
MKPFLRTFAVLCIVAGALQEGGAAWAPPRAVPPLETKFSSLSQACHGFLEKECPPDGVSRTDCLMEHIEGNDNHECKLWLAWRATCFATAIVNLIPNGLCNFTSDQATSKLIRRCLRHVDKNELPRACSASPYFKSLMLRAPRRMDSDAAGDL